MAEATTSPSSDPEVAFRWKQNYLIVDEGNGDKESDLGPEYDSAEDVITRDIGEKDNCSNSYRRRKNLQDATGGQEATNRRNSGDDINFPLRKEAALYYTIKPESYHGADNWEEYISHFENCAELGCWSSRTKLLYLSANLKGAARTFYVSLPPVDKESFGSLSQSLNRRFGSSKHPDRWLSRLESRRRMPGENIAAVADEIRQMTQKAYRDLGMDAQEVLALNQLYRIISTDMKCRCMDKECTTISEAVNVIERYESIVGEGDDKKQPSICVIEQKIKTEGSDKVLLHELQQDILTTLQAVLSRLERLETNANKSAQRFICYICGIPNHFARECPNRIGRSNNNGGARGYMG